MKMVKSLCACFFVFAFLCLLPQNSQAHRLNIYAWLEGNQIVVDSNFGKNQPARNAQIRILDSDTGTVLIQGQTSKNGVFSFPVPREVQEGHGLLIEVNAGQGHFSDWKMDASELYAAASLTAGFDQEAIDLAKERGTQPAQNSAQPGGAYQIPSNQSLAQTPEQAQTVPTAQPKVSAQNIPMPTNTNHEEMRGIIEQAMANQMRTVHQAIAQQNGPTLVNIIGGLGWIIGIVGIYLYSRARRELAKKSSKNEN